MHIGSFLFNAIMITALYAEVYVQILIASDKFGPYVSKQLLSNTNSNGRSSSLTTRAEYKFQNNQCMNSSYAFDAFEPNNSKHLYLSAIKRL